VLEPEGGGVAVHPGAVSCCHLWFVGSTSFSAARNRRRVAQARPDGADGDAERLGGLLLGQFAPHDEEQGAPGEKYRSNTVAMHSGLDRDRSTTSASSKSVAVSIRLLPSVGGILSSVDRTEW
jgi:hypothetical protein